MPTTRFLQPGGDGYYHCVSRVVDRRFVFDTDEKRHFRLWMRKLEAFCGVEVITYCLMSNHFHILLRVPDKEAAPKLTVERLLGLLPLIYRGEDLLSAVQEIERALAAQDEAWVGRILARYEARRHSLPVFMKELKQRFTRWFNRQHSRKGTLWEERYRSVLVEGSASTLATVAAYVDLNPVRAGIVENPEDYPWCGYAEACGGGKEARQGLLSILGREAAGAPAAVPGPAPTAEGAGEPVEAENGEALGATGSTVLAETLWPPLPGASKGRRAPTWQDFGAGYRLLLFEEGVEIAPDAASGDLGRRGIRAERVEQERRRGGRLSLRQALRCRTRHFTEGAVLGSEAFVDSIFEVFREYFGAKRESGARPLRGVEAEGLHAMRDLQSDPVG